MVYKVKWIWYIKKLLQGEENIILLSVPALASSSVICFSRTGHKSALGFSGSYLVAHVEGEVTISF